MAQLARNNVPADLIPLLPVASKWGICDDIEREQAILQASHEDLNELVHCIDAVSDEAFYGWLAGPESFKSKPSHEYVSLSCLALAIDSARLKLAKSQSKD